METVDFGGKGVLEDAIAIIRLCGSLMVQHMLYLWDGCRVEGSWGLTHISHQQACGPLRLRADPFNLPPFSLRSPEI